MASEISALATPSLLLDEARMMKNIERLNEHATSLNVPLRPHLKTCKSVEVARRLVPKGGRITVSTLLEAKVFFEAGYTDIIYAVGIVPQKLPLVSELRERGCDLTVILDTVEQAAAAADFRQKTGVSIPVLIEIDSDGHRGGVRADSPELFDIAEVLRTGNVELRGVLTHAGESYGAVDKAAQANFAEMERSAAVYAAEQLRNSGFSTPIVSVGSTPTAHAAKDLSGVTELRAGVYVFFDLVMAGIGVCGTEDIAVSVLTTVMGRNRTRGQIFVDAGWMALSRDRGTANQAVDQGYGLVCTVDGEVIPDIIVVSANQEHGVIASRPNSNSVLPDFPIGTQLRILPNHACSTCSQFQEYNVIPVQGPLQQWPRFNGW